MDYQHRPGLPMAFALLVECCARSFTSVARRITAQPTDAEWVQFLHLSRRHRVQGLAWRGLRSGQLAPPAPIAEALAADARDIAWAGLNAVDGSARLHDALGEAGIDHLFVKGLTLSMLAYGDPFLKMSNDIDVLVAPASVGDAALVLGDLGYRMVEPASGSAVEWHATRMESVWLGRDGAIVELHSRLAENRRLIPSIGLGSPRQAVPVAPGIALPTLGDDVLLTYLAVHGSSSAWFRLKWIADFAAMVELRTIEELDQLAMAAERDGAGRTVAQALLLATTLFGCTISKRLAKAIDTRTNRTFVHLALAELLQDREPLDRPLGTAGIHAAQLLVAPGARFALSEIRRQAAQLFRRR